MAHKLGTPVQQIVQPVKGRVVRTAYNESTEKLEHCVESYDGTQQFWIAAESLEVDPVQQAADEAAVAAAGESTTEGEHA